MGALSHDDRLGIVLAFGVVSTAMLVRWIDSAWADGVFRSFGAYGVFGLVAVWFNGRTRHLTIPRFQKHLRLYFFCLYFLLSAGCAGAVVYFLELFQQHAWIARGLLWLGYAVPNFLIVI